MPNATPGVLGALSIVCPAILPDLEPGDSTGNFHINLGFGIKLGLDVIRVVVIREHDVELIRRKAPLLLVEPKVFHRRCRPVDGSIGVENLHIALGAGMEVSKTPADPAISRWSAMGWGGKKEKKRKEKEKINNSRNVRVDDLKHQKVTARRLYIESFRLGTRRLRHLPFQVFGSNLVRGVFIFLNGNRPERLGAVYRFCGSGNGS